MRLGILRAGRRSARELADHSRSALDRVLAHPGELWVAVADDDATLLGAFQRETQRERSVPAATLWRRGSGGPEVRVGPGTVHIALALAHPGALVACDEKRIVNRMVRPLLKGLTKAGALAHYFGRDWVSVRHRPAAWVGFAHDAATRRTLFEAFVAVQVPFSAERGSFLGKAPGTIEEITGAAVSPEHVAGAVAEAYACAWPAQVVPMTSVAVAEVPDAIDGTPWAATAEEAIGLLGAGPDACGAFRIGGDLLVSRDALAGLEAAAPGTPDDALGALVDAALAAPGVALDGVRSLTTIRDLIVRARDLG